MPGLRILTLALALAVLVGAGVATARYSLAAPGRAAHSKLLIKDSSGQYVFSPTKKTVKKGTVVTWQNTSSAPHTVTGTSKNWKFKSKSISTGGKVTLTFTKAGTYHYYCAIHPYMKGTIVVK